MEVVAAASRYVAMRLDAMEWLVMDATHTHSGERSCWRHFASQIVFLQIHADDFALLSLRDGVAHAETCPGSDPVVVADALGDMKKLFPTDRRFVRLKPLGRKGGVFIDEEGRAVVCRREASAWNVLRATYDVLFAQGGSLDGSKSSVVGLTVMKQRDHPIFDD
jgi:hypothetical protein